MKKKFSLKELLAIGGLAALLTVIKLIGSSISTISGFLWLGGLVNGLIEPIVLVLSLFILNHFGSATVMYAIISLFELPLPLRGPPGWAIKIPILILGGLVFDLVYKFLKKNKKVASVAVGIIFQAYIGLTILGVGYLLKVPLLYNSALLFFSYVGVITVLVFGTFGGYFGYLVYQKIRNTAVVKRIQGGK